MNHPQAARSAADPVAPAATAAGESLHIADIDATGAAPEADAIRIFLPGVALPIQKAYGIGQRMRRDGATEHTQVLRRTDGRGEHRLVCTLDGSTLTLRRQAPRGTATP